MKIIDIKNKKDLLFYIALAIIGGGFLYYIFFIDGKEEENLQITTINSELPDANIEPLRDKKTAYENQRYEDSKDEKMKSLQDYMFDLSNPDNNTDEKNYVVDINQTNTAAELSNKLNTTNARIYQDFDDLAIENERLAYEVEKLRKEKRESSSGSSNFEREKIEMMKQFAQAYTTQPEVKEPEVVNPYKDAVEVTKVDKDVVTTISDDMYLDKPYNAGFITAVGTGYETGKNTIKACIYEEITIMDGERVMLKLLEPLQAGSTIIPKNQLCAGSARIQGDRLDIIISSIEYAGNIIPVHLKVYDTDGVNGIFCPGSAELTATKEAAANASSGISSLSIARNAGQQIAMDASRAVMQGGAQLLSKKMRTVKVTLKANYQVLLLPQK